MVRRNVRRRRRGRGRGREKEREGGSFARGFQGGGGRGR